MSELQSYTGHQFYGFMSAQVSVFSGTVEAKCLHKLSYRHSGRMIIDNNSR